MSRAPQLRRELGVADATMLGLGSILGTGLSGYVMHLAVGVDVRTMNMKKAPPC